MSANPTTPWEDTFRVRSYEADANGFASPVSICNYIQESAGNHAHHLGFAIDQLMERERTWVLFRLSLRMNAYPRWRDDIVVTTWPAGAHRIYAHRDFLVRDLQGGSLGAAGSIWLLVDLNTRRPLKMPAEIDAMAMKDRPRARSADLEKRLVPPKNPAMERRFIARTSDIDVNRHVNNVRFIDWALEAVPRDVREQKRLVELDAEFLAEGFDGDEVASAAEDCGEGRYAHHISRVSDDKRLAIAMSRWG